VDGSARGGNVEDFSFFTLASSCGQYLIGDRRN
jgi:hypothetical protein